MPAAYLKAPHIHLAWRDRGCGKVPLSRKEALRIASGRSPFAGNTKPKLKFVPQGINVYICEICQGGVYHTGHR